MTSSAFLARLGVDGSGGDRTFAWRIVAASLLLYALGFALWFPSSVPTNTDEAMFVTQTQLLLQGKTAIEKVDPFTGESFPFIQRPYPNGLPLLMAPFVWVADVPGAYGFELLSLIAAVLLLGRWLQEQGYSPLFALLALGFVPTLVMGRVAMSDVPSLFLVTLGLWLFWRGLDGSWLWWLASALLAGSAMYVRVTNCLPFVGLFAGTVLRRDPRCLALIVGGLVGVGIRLLGVYLQFGDPFAERGSYNLALDSIGERLPLFLFGVLVLVPGGLLAAFAYRGRRWPEVIFSVVLYFLFYLCQLHSTDTTGFAKRLVLALRYFVELLPLLVLCMAETVPRAVGAVKARLTEPGRARALRVLSWVVAAWVAGVAVAAFAVHPVVGRWGASQAAIATAIHEHTGDDSVLITDPAATRKFLRETDRRFLRVDLRHIEPGDVAELARRHGEVFIALLDRSDSPYWRERAAENAAFVAALEPGPVLEHDRRYTPSDRLRIWRLQGHKTE